MRNLSNTGITVAAISTVIMMLLTIADILGRRFLGTPVIGVYELVQLTLTGAVFGGLAKAGIDRSHITVDLIDNLAPGLVKNVLNPMAAIATILTLCGLLWAGFLQAQDAYRFRDTTMDLRISVLWFWAPILVGLLAGLITSLTNVKRSEV